MSATVFYKSQKMMRKNRFHIFHSANFGPVDCLSTRLFLDGPKIAEEFEVQKSIQHNGFICQASLTPPSSTCVSSNNFQ